MVDARAESSYDHSGFEDVCDLTLSAGFNGLSSIGVAGRELGGGFAQGVLSAGGALPHTLLACPFSVVAWQVEACTALLGAQVKSSFVKSLLQEGLDS